jgi:hypothetical protein
MMGMEWILDTLLVVLLTATLFHAVRLERALGVLKRDRVALQELVASFDASSRAAETGIERLQAAAEGPGRQIQRMIESGTTLKEDLTFLVQRGEGLADRLDECVRATRPALAAAPLAVPGMAVPGMAVPGLAVAGMAVPGLAVTQTPSAHSSYYAAQSDPVEPPRRRAGVGAAPREAEPKVRSQAERDLLKALRMVR